MSLSRIIKSASPVNAAINSFSYLPLSDQVQSHSNGAMNSNDFIPMIICHEEENIHSFPNASRTQSTVIASENSEKQLKDNAFMPLIMKQTQMKDNHTACNGEPCLPALIEVSDAISDESLQKKVGRAFDEGVIEGWRLAEEAMNSKCRAIIEAVEYMVELREKILHECEDDLLKLSLIVARKIIHREISLDRQIVVNVVAAAVRTVSEQDGIVIRLNPSDYEAVAEKRNFCLSGDEERRLVLKADETVPLGGCMVDTTMGVIDAGIETRLEEICCCLLNGQKAAYKDSIEEGVVIQHAKT